MPTTREERRLLKLQDKLERRNRLREDRNNALTAIADVIRRNARLVAAALGLYILGEIVNAQAYLTPVVLASCLIYIGWALWKLETGRNAR